MEYGILFYVISRAMGAVAMIFQLIGRDPDLLRHRGRSGRKLLQGGPYRLSSISSPSRLIAAWRRTRRRRICVSQMNRRLIIILIASPMFLFLIWAWDRGAVGSLGQTQPSLIGKIDGFDGQNRQPFHGLLGAISIPVKRVAVGGCGRERNCLDVGNGLMSRRSKPARTTPRAKFL